ncbi:hypothetical protein SOMG_03874 [Schizosaccharomyces osmophilus]|uniref:Uncharacterized protein n=1 Tax=Schizosaccharomyces osmophilus TaxID=2545709 RepID=A0AAF0AWA2_9SCHI|nr:uncharacterized protein SOMG_03874 [Schizosaccharomyces osmophilus]WBW73367.1 hypothetical protein SOMG_03874 [Schizosaccharomyces osmophilus]
MTERQQERGNVDGSGNPSVSRVAELKKESVFEIWHRGKTPNVGELGHRDRSSSFLCNNGK